MSGDGGRRARARAAVTRLAAWRRGDPALADEVAALHEMTGAVNHVVRQLDERMHVLEDAQRKALAGIDRLQAGVDHVAALVHNHVMNATDRIEAEQAIHREVLKTIVTEEAANRRRLHEARQRPEYARAWDDSDPLVSVCIATYRRSDVLCERALPSILAQTHPTIEVVVVGDATDDDTASRIESMGDPRVHFRNLPHRIVPDGGERRHWLTASTAARNEAHQHTRGLWVVDADDDDVLRPHHLERLLDLARRERAEVAYGRAERHFSGGERDVVGRFPPVHGGFTWMAAIRHAGLGWLNREYVAGAFELPGDWYLAERLLRIGARFAMTDEVVCDLYPSAMHGDSLPPPPPG